MNDSLLKEITDILKLTEDNGIVLTERKKIPYGEKLFFEKGLLRTSLSLYFSKKKGVSKILNGQENTLKNNLENLLFEKETNEYSYNWNSWFGTDESGKGDFFGPLVVAGFLCHKEDVFTLKKLGVKDSKMLNDNKIKNITKKVYEKFNKNISVIIIYPEKYNNLYASFEKSGKKLNQLLAWMHGRIIKDVSEKEKFDGIIVDKFASDDVLFKSLKGLRNLNIVQRIKAEEDIAVATASIIARYHFVQKMKIMSKQYGMNFPKGSSKEVINVGKLFAEKFGENRMNEVAKLHFKTFEKIKGII
jgi:ribonuclease HIII